MVDNFSTGFSVVFVVIAVIIAIVFVFVIVNVVRNVGKANRQGIDPFTAQTDIAAKLLNSDVLSAEKPIAERLAEVDALFAAGTISADEHRAARAAILAAG
jgi:competence protein ComGC